MSHTDYADYTENALTLAPSGVDLKVAIPSRWPSGWQPRELLSMRQ